jgi:hypothetical protein
MPTTPNMLLVMPTEGGSNDIWDTILNTLFGVVDTHDHTTGKGVKVPSAALKIDADVSWASGGSNYAITDIKAFDFIAATAASVAGYAGALFVNGDDVNNLYFRTVGGVNVKITDGATLNVSIVGGIGGDYSTVGALLDYDDATDTYRFRQETAAAVRQFAKVSMADLIIREYDPAGDASVPVETVTVKSPDALAASYELTLLTALPVGARAMQVDNTGAITASNTFVSTITTTEFKHTSALGLQINAMSAIDPNATHTRLLGAVGAQVGWTLGASTDKIAFPIDLPIGSQITLWTAYFNKTTGAAVTLTGRIYSTRTSVLGTETAESAGNSNNANNPGFILLQEAALAITMLAGREYYLVITPSAAGAGDVLYNAEIAYTRP